MSTGHGIPHNSPPKGRTGLRVTFELSCHTSLGIHFSEVGPLVLPQLTITISFYDLLIIYTVVIGLMNFVVVAHKDVKFRDQVSVSRLFETENFHVLVFGLLRHGLVL